MPFIPDTQMVGIYLPTFSCIYLENIFGIYLEYIWNIFGTYLEYIWNIFGIYLGIYLGICMRIYLGIFLGIYSIIFTAHHLFLPDTGTNSELAKII